MRRLLAGQLLFVVMLASGCQGKSIVHEPTTAPARLILDAAPYLCDLVPEHSFREVSGVAGSLAGRWDGHQTDYGLCLAWGAQNSALLGISWSYNDGEQVIERQEKAWLGGSGRSPVRRLPPELGRGLAVSRFTLGGDQRPNYVIALFKCGGRATWISIDIPPVVRGRDALGDLVEFMRIAERRFGELHRCTPRPS
ncbi:hypothetical protein [Actinomadura parmotrematis]|uniref:DUF3558 domain-containing protein n=1 Tax=Actinomadura parmotrematis TaxID=2864039 RepID=A0ABS7FWA8_9ACTN|nr:hypothetical protein [Actinomadura parmotrematis]MBW8484712.1 hypothetical protein [Actinomadura parmotrematis]